MGYTWFLLLTLKRDEDYDTFESQSALLKKFDCKLNAKEDLGYKSFFGTEIYSNYDYSQKIIKKYTDWLSTSMKSIPFRLYFVGEDGTLEMHDVEEGKTKKHTIELKASLVVDKKTKIPLSSPENMVLTLDSFNPPNNITILINDEYGFDYS